MPGQTADRIIICAASVAAGFGFANHLLRKAGIEMLIPALRRRDRVKKSAKSSRWTLLAWATLAAVVCGIIDFGEPFEDAMRIGRNALRAQSASRDTVMISIDDRTVQATGNWPWPRRVHAQLLDNLVALGAKRVFFDFNVQARSDEVDDRRFVQMLSRARGRVVLPTRLVVDANTHRQVNLLPLDSFRRLAQIGAINVLRGSFGSVWSLPHAVKVGQQFYPSFSTLLANREVNSDAMYRPDYSIQYKSIPTVNAAEVLSKARSANIVRGKDVIVALDSDRLGDNYFIPGQGLAGGGYLHIIGAETLKRGSPVELGWVGSMLLILALSLIYISTRRKWVAFVVPVLAVASFTIVPLLLESRQIHITIFPAMLLFGSVATVRIWRLVKERSATVNALSGLPNLNALRRYHQQSSADVPLVAARIQNYSEITSALPTGTEEMLIAEIARRFDLGIGGATLFQGDGGMFVWIARQSSVDSIGDEIEGLHALLTSPVAVAGQHVDLTVTFGVDTGAERQLANRIGSALLAADEAASAGLKWKAYDPARLQHAEWKLSLLGRLDTAIDTGEIWIAYQPKLHVATNQIIGAEALVRWTHPEKGPIAPDDFITVAEQHNRIEKLTTHVFHEAIKAAALINAHDISFNIAVNLSARLLESPHLVQFVTELLAAYDLAPENLTIEVTESAAMVDNKHSVKMLEELRATGIQISIDDYGTGFSTLDYLRTIPATEIKIDKSFVAAMDRSQSDRLMVNSTIQLAHSLGRTVVAEGVETPTILRALTEMGCDKAQGYLIGRPMKLIGLTRLLLAERRQLAA